MTKSNELQRAVEVFFSYSHRDDDLRQELETHLALLKREGLIRTWHDRRIAAGDEWAGAIDAHLESAEVVLLLVSADFLASGYCYDLEMKRALERHERGECRVIPIILRPADWHTAPFSELQALPRDAKPVTSWLDRDKAFVDVARGIRAVIAGLPELEPDSTNRKAETHEKLVVGARLKGTVTHLANYGAFIDLGGIDGLLHITDISWGQIKHPSELEEGVEGLIQVSEMSWTKKVVNPAEILNVGDEVEAIVSDLEMDKRRG